jgi:hypothetical protein
VTDEELDTLELFHTPSAPAYVAMERRPQKAHQPATA